MISWIRVIKNIPLRFNEEVSFQLGHGSDLGWRSVFLSKTEHIVCPNDALVVSVWRFHACSRKGRAELREFLKLSNGCSNLLDIGASAGIFSALFANTRQKSKILSIEPDPKSFELLRETISLNSLNSPEWTALQALVSNQSGTLQFDTTGFGGTISDIGIPITSYTLTDLLKQTEFVPDIIKIDVESHEYEIITAGFEWIEKNRPKLFLEIHWKFLEDRSIDATQLLKLLAKIGYGTASGRSIDQRKNHKIDVAGVSRIGLSPFPPR